jgi:hypothetical protein
MKKYKNTLISIMALNALTFAYGVSAPVNTGSIPNERLYNQVTEAVSSGKSINSSYKQLEEILNQRNKELKDLYKQGDYIVKPEYLEWQIFFSAFYAEKRKGDNTLNNAKYYSDPEKTPTKPIETQPPVDVNIGLAVRVKGLETRDRSLGITIPEEININPAVINILAPATSAIVAISPLQFQPVYPSIPTINVHQVTPLVFSFSGSANGDQEWVNNNGNVAPLAQQILTGQSGGGTLEVVSYSNSPSSQNFDMALHNTDATGISGGAANTLTPHGIQNFNWSGQTSSHAVMKLVGGHSIDIENMFFNFVGSGNKQNNYLMLFHTDAHDDGNNDAVWNLSGNVQTLMNGQDLIFWGVQSHSTRTMGAQMINNGTITADASQSVNIPNLNANLNVTPTRRIIFTTIDANSGDINYYNRYFDFINNGTIELLGTSDILANFATPGTATGGTRLINNGSITLAGLNSIGVLLNNSVSNMGDARILLNTPLEITGDDSIGIQATNSTINLDNSVIKLNIGKTGNDISSTGNKAGNDTTKVEDASGIVVDSVTAPLRMSNYDILLGSAAKNSTGVIVQNGNMTLGYSSAAGTTQQITSNGGIENNLLVASGTASSITTEANTTLNILNGFGQVGIFSNQGAVINNAGTLNASGAGTIGVITNNGTINNTGNLNISGGVYTDQQVL